jgi:hypothetical protein
MALLEIVNTIEEPGYDILIRLIESPKLSEPLNGRFMKGDCGRFAFHKRYKEYSEYICKEQSLKS